MASMQGSVEVKSRGECSHFIQIHGCPSERVACHLAGKVTIERDAAWHPRVS